ncbi:MAG: hypothetical protein JRJ13_07250 [Deltaproteobacteria bacterium]|nr:hypothetical protein [Deltaproteobacteria bacterium]
MTPKRSDGNQDIVITGRAVERSSGLPMAGVPLNLVITLQGFERKYQVITGDDGSFSHTFTPLSGEAGVYAVRAVHPDRTDRPVQATFTINRVHVSPSSIKLNIPRNYEKTIKVNVATGEGTEVSNLRFVYDEADQPGGVFPEGVHLSVGSPVGFLGPRKSARLPFTIWADNSAAESGSIVLKVVSDETAPGAWRTIRVSTHFSEAKPVLYLPGLVWYKLIYIGSVLV